MVPELYRVDSTSLLTLLLSLLFGEFLNLLSQHTDLFRTTHVFINMHSQFQLPGESSNEIGDGFNAFVYSANFQYSQPHSDFLEHPRPCRVCDAYLDIADLLPCVPRERAENRKLPIGLGRSPPASTVLVQNSITFAVSGYLFVAPWRLGTCCNDLRYARAAAGLSENVCVILALSASAHRSCEMFSFESSCGLGFQCIPPSSLQHEPKSSPVENVRRRSVSFGAGFVQGNCRLKQRGSGTTQLIEEFWVAPPDWTPPQPNEREDLRALNGTPAARSFAATSVVGRG